MPIRRLSKLRPLIAAATIATATRFNCGAAGARPGLQRESHDLLSAGRIGNLAGIIDCGIFVNQPLRFTDLGLLSCLPLSSLAGMSGPFCRL
jgi:hypothetical protein